MDGLPYVKVVAPLYYPCPASKGKEFHRKTVTFFATIGEPYDPLDRDSVRYLFGGALVALRDTLDHNPAYARLKMGRPSVLEMTDKRGPTFRVSDVYRSEPKEEPVGVELL